MKFRTTYILFVIFALLAGYVYFFELNKKPAETPTDKSTWVLTLATDDVQQLTVTSQGQTAFLVRSGDTWLLGGEGGQEADVTRVDSVIASLVDLKAARVLTQTAEGLAAYGLDTPAINVTLGLSNNQQEVLYIGGKNPQGSQYYAQRKGQTPVYMFYSSVVDELTLLISEPPIKPTPVAPPTPAPATVAPAATPKP